MPSSTYLTTTQVARRWKKDRHVISEMCKSGELQAVKFPRKFLIHINVVKEYEAKHGIENRFKRKQQVVMAASDSTPEQSLEWLVDEIFDNDKPFTPITDVVSKLCDASNGDYKAVKNFGGRVGTAVPFHTICKKYVSLNQTKDGFKPHLCQPIFRCGKCRKNLKNESQVHDCTPFWLGRSKKNGAGVEEIVAANIERNKVLNFIPDNGVVQTELFKNQPKKTENMSWVLVLMQEAAEKLSVAINGLKELAGQRAERVGS